MKAVSPAVPGKPELSISASIKQVPRLGHVDTITVLYASTQGNSRAFADRLARGLQESDLNELSETPKIRVSCYLRLQETDTTGYRTSEAQSRNFFHSTAHF